MQKNNNNSGYGRCKGADSGSDSDVRCGGDGDVENRNECSQKYKLVWSSAFGPYQFSLGVIASYLLLFASMSPLSRSISHLNRRYNANVISTWFNHIFITASQRFQLPCRCVWACYLMAQISTVPRLLLVIHMFIFCAALYDAIKPNTKIWSHREHSLALALLIPSRYIHDMCACVYWKRI